MFKLQKFFCDFNTIRLPYYQFIIGAGLDKTTKLCYLVLL
jgi:hypothetical protein